MSLSLLPRKAAFQFFFVVAAIGITSADSFAVQHRGGHVGDHVEKATFNGDAYLLDTDPVTGDALGAIDEQVIVQHAGREFRFSGPVQAKAFQKNPGKYVPAVDAEIARQQLPFYPLDTCLVSGQKLGGMGEPVNFVYSNRLVRFCCGGCQPKFLQDPGRFLPELDAAVIQAQLADYPLETCVVSGEKLAGSMGDPIEFVVGNHLVRFCCKGCRKDFAKDPLSYLQKIEHGAAMIGGHESGGHPAPMGRDKHAQGHGPHEGDRCCSDQR